MTLPTRITITNAQVNSGATIDLKAKTIRTTWETFTNVRDTPSKSVSDTYDARLGKGINTGFSNPVHIITGVFDLNSAHTSGANAPIDWEYIEELIKRSDVICSLVSSKFITTTNATGAKNVMLKSVNTTNPNSNVVNFTLNCVEVNSSS